MTTFDQRIFNFSPGPSALPQPVLEQAQRELLNYRGSGMSIMEMSHRSPLFYEIVEGAREDLRTLLAIPRDYQILFTVGGAIGQFAALPLNLAADGRPIDFVDSGHWAQRALSEAGQYNETRVIASSRANNYTAVPPQSEWQLSDDAAYVHYCPNETVLGMEYHWVPDTGDIPLVADASSNILSRPLDVSKFGAIIAGAQKNIGPAGVSLVIVREDLLGRFHPHTPTVHNYTFLAQEGGSMVNTPPVFPWYMASLVFRWLREQGGLEAMEAINRRKAEALYQCIDDSDLYANRIHPDSRSRMNVTFDLTEPQLLPRFLREAEAAGLHHLKGHPALGGLRASIYNAVPEQAVTALVEFMQAFEARYG